jgi:hypothetical protein
LAIAKINNNHPREAIDRLKEVAPYELGEPRPLGGTLYPIYTRGQPICFYTEGMKPRPNFRKL